MLILNAQLVKSKITLAKNNMIVNKRSMVSGIVHSKELPVTEEQVKRWESGELIHNAFPDLSADDREFLLTGIVGDEWSVLYPED